MATNKAQSAYKGEIKLEFRYKKSINSSVDVEEIESQRISYLMIEHMYENVHILPVIYVSINLSSEMYSKVVGTQETSKFRLQISKKNALSKTSIYKRILDDEFTYVVSSNSANYTDTLDAGAVDAYKNVIIGLVSERMTNLLRQSYNQIYNNVYISDIIDVAMDGLGTVIKAPLEYNMHFDSILIPPISSRYKLLEYIRQKAPFYNSNYTFYMDFNKTYLIPKNANPVDDGSNPNTANIIIKNYTAQEAFKDGYSLVNGAYLVYINATDTNMVINTSTSKVTNNIIGYSDYYSEAQNYTIDNTIEGNTTKTTFVKTNNAAEIRNELENNSVMIQIMKQNVNGDIFNPNMCFNVTNYGDYSKYDGRYYISFKREFYYLTENSDFTISCNIGLKLAGQEEVAYKKKNSYYDNKLSIKSGKFTSTGAQYTGSNSTIRSKA